MPKELVLLLIYLAAVLCGVILEGLYIWLFEK